MNDLAAVDGGDVDDALRALEGLLADRRWETVLELRDRCRAAIERGHQMWPVAAHAEYRLALEAPGRFAAAVVQPGTGRFAPGPIPEVAASTHVWEELAPWLTPSPATGRFAHERVVRGDDLTGEAAAAVFDDLQMPLRLRGFEPAYALAEYRADGMRVDEPDEPSGAWTPVSPRPSEPTADPRTAPLREPVDAWATESEGRVRVIAVAGGVEEALGALGAGAEARARPLTAAEALHRLAHAGATAGVHGRRRGAAQGRFAAWFALAGVAGLDWPPDPAALEDGLHALRFHEWDDGQSPPWSLRIVIEAGERTLALDAIDA